MGTTEWEWEMTSVGGRVVYYLLRNNKHIVGLSYHCGAWIATGPGRYTREIQTVLRVSEKLARLTPEEAMAVTAATVLTMI